MDTPNINTLLYGIEPIRVISLGAGVQSSTMALMFAHGELTPMPHAAIFADTGEEPESVYKWLDWLQPKLEPYFPVYRVGKAVGLGDEALKLRVSRKTGNVYARTLVPAFFQKQNGSRGLMGRRCTAEFKSRELEKKQRQLAKAAHGRLPWTQLRVVTYIGISTDEPDRMKPAPPEKLWNEIQWPLIQQANMSRNDCIAWMLKRGYPRPPRSACKFCPFHSDEEWSRLKHEEPKEFAAAVEFDKKLRYVAAQQTGTAAIEGAVYLHSSLKPLDEVKFADRPSARDHFANECAGMCGV